MKARAWYNRRRKNPERQPFHLASWIVPRVSGHPHSAQESTEMRSLHQRSRQAKKDPFSVHIVSVWGGGAAPPWNFFYRFAHVQKRLLTAEDSQGKKGAAMVSGSDYGAWWSAFLSELKGCAAMPEWLRTLCQAREDGVCGVGQSGGVGQFLAAGNRPNHQGSDWIQ